MKKRLLSILSITCILFFSAGVTASAAADVNVDEMAVYLDHNYNDSGSATVSGSVYSANGNVAVESSAPLSGSIYHKTGTAFTYPSWYQWSHPNFKNQGVELDNTVFDESFPVLREFPVFENKIQSYTASDFSSPVISENTSIGTLYVNKNITVDVSRNDIYLVVDKLTFKNNGSNYQLKLSGSNKLYLFIKQYDHDGPMVISNNKNPDSTYIVSKSNLPDEENKPLYAHIFYQGVDRINFSGSVTGSVATDATAVTLSDNEVVNGLLYAPNAAVTISGSSYIKGRVVADSLLLSGNSRVTYNSSYAVLSVPAGLQPQEPELYKVNVNVNLSGAGTVTPTHAEANYGEVVKITATANNGYRFTGFSSSDSSMIPDSQGNLTVTGSVNIIANFEAIPVTGDYVNGLLGKYYDASEFDNESALRMIRIDSGIAYNFMYDSPDEAIEPETFAIRWTGYIKPSVTGNYTFKTFSDDGVVVYVNNTKVIDNWGAFSLDFTLADNTVYLEAGKYYPITVEYQQLPLYAAVFLFWEADGVPMSLVPGSAYYVTTSDFNSYSTAQYYNPVARSGEGFYNKFYTQDNDGNKSEEFSEVNNIVYYWGEGAPGNITEDVFYGEMEGYLEAKFTENTTLEFLVDDGIKVWLGDEKGNWFNNGNPVINEWDWHNVETFQYSFDTVAGKKYKIRIEYIDKGFGASCVMRWKGHALGDQDIPKSYMYTEL